MFGATWPFGSSVVPSPVETKQVPSDDKTSKDEREPLTPEEVPLTLSQKCQKALAAKQDIERKRIADLRKQNTETITNFIIEHVEPHLETQALTGAPKMLYLFSPSDSNSYIPAVLPKESSILKRFDGNQKEYILRGSKEHVKSTKLFGQKYDKKFWQQPGVIEELEAAIKAKLRTNGEKIAAYTTRTIRQSWNLKGWFTWKTYAPGYIGVEVEWYNRLQGAGMPGIVVYVEIS